MIDRCTNLTVDVDVEMRFHCGNVGSFRIVNIPCVWQWDEVSRDAACYWAAFDHIGENYNFDWMSIKCWSSSPVKEKVQ